MTRCRGVTGQTEDVVEQVREQGMGCPEIICVGCSLPFARYWMHFNMITLEGDKMSKSRDHFVTLQELFSRFDPLTVRFYLLRAHYRSVVDFTEEGMDTALQGLRRLRETYLELSSRVAEPDRESRHPDIDVFRNRFSDAMNDDLNTPQAPELPQRRPCLLQ